jgi:hypothetical protein
MTIEFIKTMLLLVATEAQQSRHSDESRSSVFYTTMGHVLRPASRHDRGRQYEAGRRSSTFGSCTIS